MTESSLVQCPHFCLFLGHAPHVLPFDSEVTHCKITLWEEDLLLQPQKAHLVLDVSIFCLVRE